MTQGEATGEAFRVQLDQEEAYRFSVDFQQAGVPPLVMDEPAPLGSGAGPNASRVLAAATGHCLSASALFCLSKARIPVSGIRTTVSGTLERNPRGRLRIGGLRVHIDLRLQPEDRARAARCLELFEDFCVVTQSVRDGITVEVTVEPPATGG
ncbi:MAG TPA: OsmC family protein [Candidatus Dormibacteraeota bacterium]|nr:OsmC family protein [Candidatus Dormibacteraeota bacterium]